MIVYPAKIIYSDAIVLVLRPIESRLLRSSSPGNVMDKRVAPSLKA
jgi:hypothetical protein